MLTPEQSRAARAWLEWSQEDLATRASVSLSTVRDFEKGRRTPITNNIQAMRRAIEDAGMQLLFDAEGKGVGVARHGYAPTGVTPPDSLGSARDRRPGTGGHE